METTTRTVESFFNRINDWDGTWIGFRRLKPAQNEEMSTRTVMVVSAFYAPACALVAAFLSILGGLGASAIWTASIAAAGAFVLLQSLSAFFWGQRASALRADPDYLDDRT